MIVKFVAALHEVAPVKQATVQVPEGWEFTKTGASAPRGTEIHLWLKKPQRDTEALLRRVATHAVKRGLPARWKKTYPLDIPNAVNIQGELRLGRKTIKTNSYTHGKNTWIILRMNEDLRGNKNRSATPRQIRAFIRKTGRLVPLSSK